MSDIDALFDSLTALQASRSRPPVHLWHPEQVGAIDIRIAENGAWYHEGDPIPRQALVNLFASILRREGGDYFLVTPVEKLRISVDDVPFVLHDMDVRGAGRHKELLFTTNVQDYVTADAEHALEMREGIPYLHVRDELYARASRPVYYRLIEEGEHEDDEFVVYSSAARFILGRVE